MTDKHKNIALILAFVAVLFICYEMALSKTKEYRDQSVSLQQEVLLFNNVPQQLSMLKQKQVYFDSILAKYQLDGSSIQNNLLKKINEFSRLNNLKVVSFLEPHVQQQNELLVKTYDFLIEGTFNDINMLMYQLEQQTKFGEIINLHFEKKKNYKTNTYFLQARVLLKSFG